MDQLYQLVHDLKEKDLSYHKSLIAAKNEAARRAAEEQGNTFSWFESSGLILKQLSLQDCVEPVIEQDQPQALLGMQAYAKILAALRRQKLLYKKMVI